jgi:4-amino-4-deoxy-L-arabinose transferase-like glycosyltransferase
MKKIIIGISLILILGLNLFLRLYGLEKSPISINWDEAALGYNAYSLLLTGKDEYGKSWPLSLRSFNDYKPALYAYLTIPFVKVFGLNQTSTRAVSAIAGTLSILVVWCFLSFWVKKPLTRLLILGFLAVEPWRIHFSRTALETNLSAAFFILGAWWLFKSRKDGTRINWKWVAFSIIPFVLSAYSYHSARLAVPLLLMLVLFDPLKWFWGIKVKKIIKKLPRLFWVGIFALLLVPVFTNSGSREVLTRFRHENMFVRYFPFSPNELFKNDFKSWLQFNPVYYILGLILGHFSAYVSPVNYSTNIFSWIRMSVQFIPEFNLFGWLEIFFFIIGLIILIKKIKKFKYRYFCYWLVAGAAPAAVTWNWFHSLRVLNALPAVEIIMVWGIIYFLKSILKYRKWLVIILFGLFLWQSIYIINNEWVYAVWENHGEYQPGGFKEGVPLIMSLLRDYDQVIIESPHSQGYIFFLFYSAYDPRTVQSFAPLRTKPSELGSWDFDFDKIKFRKINWASDKNLKRTILWLPPVVSQEQIDKLPNAKTYYLKGPVKPYNSSVIITLD